MRSADSQSPFTKEETHRQEIRKIREAAAQDIAAAKTEADMAKKDSDLEKKEAFKANRKLIAALEELDRVRQSCMRAVALII